MKVFAIPTAVSGATAVLSVLFFTGLSHVFGDTLLGEIILLQASVALVQMAAVPQGWLYVIGSQSFDMLERRYSIAVATELAGIGAGLAALLIALALPFAVLDGWRAGAVLMYASLVIPASSSCLGWLRAREHWRAYALWVLLPNLVRVPLVWALPALIGAGAISAPPGREAIIFLLFLLPELLRWLALYLPLVVRHFRWQGLADTSAGARVILQNWFFDVGSAIAEIGDKIVVGALLGPLTLVPYFFARKLAVVATMAIEPFYAEHYRRILQTGTADRPAAERRVYRQGLLLALAIAGAMLLALLVALQLPLAASLVPASVADRFGIFIAILAVDCGIAANRWSRYVAQERGAGRLLFTVRMALFVAFVAGVALFGNAVGGFGLCWIFAAIWGLESLFVAWLIGSRRGQPPPPHEASQLS